MNCRQLILRISATLSIAPMLAIPLQLAGQAAGVAISPDGSPAHPSAMLDVSGSSRGVLIPRLSESERDGIPAPAEGLLIFNTTSKCFNVFKDSGWYEWCGNCLNPPQISASSGSPACEGENLQLNAVGPGNLSYSWSGPGGFTSSEQNPVLTGVTVSQSGLYQVVASSGSCASAPASVNVVVQPLPSPAFAGSDQLNLSGTSATLSATPPASGSGIWTIQSGTGGNVVNPASPSSGFTGVAGQTYVLRWTVSNGCGSGYDEVTVQFSAGGPRKVFMTSTTYNANLGGISGADAKCQQRAQAAGLSGTFKAWLSTSAASPATTFSQSAFPYVLTTGTQIAANWADLTDGSIATVINRDEFGNVVPFNPGGGYSGCGSWLGGYFIMAWSATKPDGTYNPPPGGFPTCQTTCSDWTSTTGGGDIWIMWNNQNTASCGESLYRLMCFEQ